MPAVISRWMIYGAYGYTAQLIVEEAVRRGHQPIIAGRDEQKLLPLAERFNLEYRVFDLQHKQKVRQAIRDVGLVLHCAGPFIETADTVRAACLDESVHYLDITGEIDVLEASYHCHEQARAQGCVIVSGVGFDVVPTDVLAFLLKQALPAAHTLELAFAGDGGVSPGTAKTLLRMLPEKGKIRENGIITTVPLGWQGKTLQFMDAERYCVTIPWGDVSTAFHSTGIANIRVYTAMEQKQQRWLRRMNGLLFLLRWPWLRGWLDKQVEKNVQGPEALVRQKASMQITGIVSDGQQTVHMQMQTPEGYTYTILSALMAVESLLAHLVMPGAYTPSQALDIDAITAMDGVSIKTIGQN